MQKIKNTLILLILSVSISAQDTLQHFSLDIVTPIIESYTSNQGYYTGHNNYGDEEFARGKLLHLKQLILRLNGKD